MQTLIITTCDGHDYKIVDFDLQLDGARAGDFCNMTASSWQEPERDRGLNFFQRKAMPNQSYKIEDLKEFNRPFTSQQIFTLIADTRGLGKRTVDKISETVSLTELAKLVQKADWDTVKSKLMNASIPMDTLIRLVRQFQQFEHECSNFNHLVVTNLLVRHKKCGMSEEQWKKCRKMIGKLVRSGMLQSDLVETIKINPYALLLEGHVKANNRHFEIIDAIAQHGPFGQAELWSLNGESRQLAGLWVSLMNNLHDNQDCYMPLDRLLTSAKSLLGCPVTPGLERRSDKFSIYRVATASARDKTVIVFPNFIDEREKLVVTHLCDYRFTTETAIAREDIVDWDPELDNGQIEVLEQLLQQGRGIITGPPGVGKTRLISALTGLLAQRGEKVILSAPTGLACKNIARNINSQCPVYTVAKLLFGSETREDEVEEGDLELDSDSDGVELPVKSTVEPPKVALKLEAELDNEAPKGEDGDKSCLLQKLRGDHHGIIIDEASMLDINQFYRLLSFLPHQNFRFILVGDPNQLPSIGPGQVFADLIKSGLMPCHNLQVNYRQRKGSQIIANAVRIMKGVTTLQPGSDFKIAHTSSDQETVELLTQFIEHLKGRDKLDDTVILSPFSKKGFLASNNLNKAIKGFFNPSPQQTWGIFALGDRVMQTRNVPKRQIVNGDIGKIIELKFKGRSSVLQRVTVEYEINTDTTMKVRYTPTEAREQLTLAYVISIHKSQGNGYPEVIVLMPHHYNHTFLNRNMLYTAVTRAKQNLYLIGGDYHAAVKNPFRTRRTRLWSRLRQAINSRKGANMPKADFVCTICNSTTADQVELPCHHRFCRTCTERWYREKADCALCRGDVVPP